MLRLLPPVCRDFGKSAERVELSPYLDFQLCSACIARRERVLRGSLVKSARRKSGRKTTKLAAVETEKKTKPGTPRKRDEP